jgi:CheY-like chemotaxis protein
MLSVMPLGESSAIPVRVLVVEDNAADRELLLRQLKKASMADQVKFISDGKEALRFLSEPTPTSGGRDLIAIFLDLKLPSLTGIDLLRALRGDPHLLETPVIVMTSSNDPRDIDECGRLGVTSYVSKPVTFDSFSKAVANVFHSPRTNSPSGVES